MNKEALHNLLDRYLKGECSEDEKRLVEQWYSMLDDQELQEPAEKELLETSARMRAHMEDGLALNDKKSGTRVMTSWRWFAIAASITAILFVSNFLIRTSAESADFLSDASAIVKIINTNASPMTLALDDSSTIVLRPNASVQFPRKFSLEKREVCLTGNAFFRIARDPKRPFLIYSQDIVTEVLGTSFSIEAEAREVTVCTGKVNVSKNVEGESFMSRLRASNVKLIPGQRVMLDNKSGRLNVSTVKVTTDEFKFRDTPLTDVFEMIALANHVVFKTKNPVDACTFTGDLSGKSLTTQLEFICRSTGLSYKKIDQVIEIEGKSCGL